MKTILILIFSLCPAPMVHGELTDGDWKEPEAVNQFESIHQEEKEIDQTLHKDLREARLNPYRFFRSGKHQRLLEALSDDFSVSSSPASLDSIEALLTSAQARHSPMVKFIANLVLFAHAKTRHPSRACLALQDAAFTAFKDIHNPQLALSVYTLASATACPGAKDSIDRVRFYLEYEWNVAKALETRWRNTSKAGQLEYAARLKKTLSELPETPLKKDVMKKIGDVYFNLKKYRSMKTWYEKAIALDSSMRKNTPIGHRIKRGDKHVVKENILYGVYTAYVAVLGMLLGRAFKSRGRIHGAFFFKRSVLFLVMYAAGSLMVYVIDMLMVYDSAMALAERYDGLTEPFVPLSFMDTSNMLPGLWMLITGFIPVLATVVYISFHTPPSRLALLGFIILALGSGWTHFFMLTAYSTGSIPSHYISGGRVYYDGELEELLLKDPGKVLKANPKLLEFENSDLKLFLKKHFPEGMPGQ